MQPGHKCPAPGCEERVPIERFACPAHWRRLPVSIRQEILTTWRERTAALKARSGARSPEEKRRRANHYLKTVGAHTAAKAAAVRFFNGDSPEVASPESEPAATGEGGGE